MRAIASWRVVTNKGEVHAEHVVNAGGLWAREVGRMVGREHPVLAMEHMYSITDEMPEVRRHQRRDRQGSGCMPWTSTARCTCARNAAACCSARTSGPASRGRRITTPWSFGHELLDSGSRSHRAVAGGGVPAFSGVAEGRHPQGGQRPVHLRAGRQSARRPVRGLSRLLVRVRRHGRFLSGRRRRARARELDCAAAIPVSTSGRMDVARFGDWASKALHEREGA